MEEKKVKIKELVGKGLGSYHTKVKQQIDRIEKKNKEQNHKISILTNELDNDYLTKTEEGSVISLDHSKEGMVYIDSLEGNTLVNYCTDGAKEMTLNGDIDASGTFVTTTEGIDGGKVDVYCEGNTMVNHCTDGAKELTLNGEIDASGTFITTTEGVDGGKVDVYCEGNTLVNLKLNSGIVCDIFCGGDKNTYCRIDECTPISIKGEILQTGQENGNTWQYYNFGRINTSMLKTNTTYTLIIKDIYNASGKVYIQNGDTSHCFTDNSSITSTYKNNLNYVVMRTKSDFANLNSNYPILYGSLSSTFKGKIDVSVIGFFEGDWTNKEIPSYFEGMKSVGQDDENGHKIEILSNNKNYLDNGENYLNWGAAYEKTNNGFILDNTIIRIANNNNCLLDLKHGETYTLSMDIELLNTITQSIQVYMHGVGATPIYGSKISKSGKLYWTFVHDKRFSNIGVYFQGGEIEPSRAIISNIILEKGSLYSSYIQRKSNTKQIPLSAPLRGLPNGVKDKFVKKEGKWYVERNCGEYIFTGLEPWSISDSSDVSKRFVLNGEFVPNLKLHSDNNTIAPIICNKYAVYPVIPTLTSTDTTGIGLTNIGFSIREAYTSLDAFKSYLTQSSIKVVYQLATPTYEPIENVELITYLETTHISNNSLIPCNMVVKNTGYNTIAIKPSTLYTVALDKTGSGTVSANLCGATATTTTNTLTLTTPATLTNALLTLSGKGIKCSNVRLLEGDKSGEIPGYFEGMKSVGELEGNKVEVLSNDDISNIEVGNFYTGISYVYPTMDFESNLRLRTKPIPIDSTKTYRMEVNSNYTFYTIFLDEEKRNMAESIGHASARIIKPPTGAKYIRFGFKHLVEKPITKKDFFKMNMVTDVPFKHNKKEISLNEPLRGLPNGVKDRFVKIGGKWYIERNCGTDTFDGSDDENWTIGNANGIENHFKTNIIKDSKQTTNIPLKCDKVNVTTHNVLDAGSEYGINLSYYLRINLPNCDVKNGATVDDLKQYLQQNPITIVYQLATPVYEPLEIEPTLNTYNDVTHISNNSIIPCNMKIQNSGYNAIIKPSTLYTVALDTNKSGTIGINLGGAKGATTNNVATVTTPATLTDDSLRISGKGIKGSKIRLLEGDKTAWIPSHFEGMKSCFEDKVQSDGTYKMEILSNNRNLINVPNMNCVSSSNGGWWNLEGTDNSMYNNIDKKTNLYFYAEKGKNYIMSFKGENVALCQRLKYQNQEHLINIGTLISKIDNHYVYSIEGDGVFSTFRFRALAEDGVTPMKITDFIVKEGNVFDKFIPHKSNKLQFSSIEPLRSVNLRNGYIKDKLIFKDGKLVIERNCKKIVLDGTQVLSRHADQSKDGTSLFGTDDLTPERPSYHVECDSFGSSGNNLMTNTTFANIEGIGCWSAKKNFNIRIKTCRLKEDTGNGIMEYVRENPITIIYPISEPTYEEIPYELQKIILEGYENGTLFIDTNIPPTVTTTYAGQTPIVSSVNTNEVAVANVTNDINEIIVPYLMDMDYRIVALQLQNEPVATMNAYKMFGSTYDMIKRDILSKRYSSTEYLSRISDYHSLGRITDSELDELKQLVTEVLSNE